MIDWKRVHSLHNDIGADGFAEVIDLFIAEVDEAMEELLNKSAAPDLEEGLHFLKGSALNLGFCDLASLCKAGETAAAAGQTDQINLSVVQSVYEASKADFMAHFSQRLAAS